MCATRLINEDPVSEAKSTTVRLV